MTKRTSAPSAKGNGTAPPATTDCSADQRHRKKFLIRLLEVGQFLKSFDFEAHGIDPYPTGYGQGTRDPDQAMQFDSEEAAWDFLFTQSQSCPLRPDGKPNRPLTVFIIEVVEWRRQ